MDSISSDARRFENEFALLLEERGNIPPHQDSIDRYWFVYVAADRPPWTDTGIEVSHGDRLSVFCAGRAWIKKHPQAWVEPYFALWLRIGERAKMFRTPKGSFTFAAGHSGRLYLSNVFPGQWVDAYGRMANTAVLKESAAGGFAVLVVRWRADPAQGLSELAQRPVLQRAWLRRNFNACATPSSFLRVGNTCRRLAMLESLAESIYRGPP